MEKVDMPMMNRAISKPASALKFDFVKENRKHLMKKDAQIAALTAPEALPATNVSDVGFVANWNTVSGANYYSVQTYRHFTTTQDVDYISLYEDFYFAEAAPDAISGKTGFTGNAGYCYVAACENEKRKFIISLLGCGWPNNKTYKWKDAMKLLEYGKANFHKETYWQEPEIPAIPVKDGTDESSGKESGKENQENPGKIHTETGTGFADAYINGRIQASDSDKKKQILLKEGEKITCHLRIEKNLTAPVKKGQKIGQVTFSLGELVLDNYFVTADRNIVKITYLWCANKVFHDFFH